MISKNQFMLKDFETRLMLLRDEAREAIRTQLHNDDNPELLTLANHIIDGCDWTEADVLNDTDIALLRQKNDRLREIEIALNRIREGKYGICQSCSEPIPVERMMAQVTCEYCVACQSKIEDAHHKNGHSM